MFRKPHILLLLVLIAGQVYAAKECKVQRYAELPITMQGTRPLVKGTINGKSALFMTDSGAFFSILNRSSAERLGLHMRLLPENFRVRGVNGTVDADATTAKDFTLDGFAGGQLLHNIDFIVGGRTLADDTDGVIGQNILGSGDSEYDLAAGVIRLFKVKDCDKTMLAYWHDNKPVAIMNLESFADNPHIVGTALLNGKKIHVTFDSGAARSVLTLDAAKRIGIKVSDEGVAAAGLGGGFAQRRLETWITHFDTLDLGGEQIKNAQLRISDMSLGGDADMLLGSDFFLSHRIFVAKSQRKVFFTYNGGPVFDLRDANVKNALAKTQTAVTEPDLPATASDSSSSESVSSPPAVGEVAEIKRRAMASAGRHEFANAIADFNTVIKADPNDADAHLQRAMAQMGDRHPELAMEDLDKAIALKADFTKALITRGEIRLMRRNESGASEDFDAAIRSAPNDTDVQGDIAEAYMMTGRFARAIGYFDTWIAAHPRDEQLPVRLTQRCRARAMVNQELELALADCNNALKKQSKDSIMLDNRALVYLRLGNYDKAIADYNASIKLQPKNPWTLYGLGLAQSHKGLQAESNKNMQAALQLGPAVADAYKRVGLGP